MPFSSPTEFRYYIDSTTESNKYAERSKNYKKYSTTGRLIGITLEPPNSFTWASKTV